VKTGDFRCKQETSEVTEVADTKPSLLTSLPPVKMRNLLFTGGNRGNGGCYKAFSVNSVASCKKTVCGFSSLVENRVHKNSCEESISDF
jgi:hypothetical protein